MIEKFSSNYHQVLFMKKNYHKQTLRTQAEKLKKKLSYGDEEQEDDSNKTIYQKYQHLYRPKINHSKLFEDGINEGLEKKKKTKKSFRGSIFH